MSKQEHGVRQARTPCPGWYRHWFTFYQQPGLRSPVCLRWCGTANPRPLTDEEWAQLISYREARGYPLDDRLEAAIDARKAEVQ